MAISGSRMGKLRLRVELRYASTTSGALCVMTSGIVLMLMWPADNLGSLPQVCICALDTDALFWVTWTQANCTFPIKYRFVRMSWVVSPSLLMWPLSETTVSTMGVDHPFLIQKTRLETISESLKSKGPYPYPLSPPVLLMLHYMTHMPAFQYSRNCLTGPLQILWLRPLQSKYSIWISNHM